MIEDGSWSYTMIGTFSHLLSRGCSTASLEWSHVVSSLRQTVFEMTIVYVCDTLVLPPPDLSPVGNDISRDVHYRCDRVLNSQGHDDGTGVGRRQEVGDDGFHGAAVPRLLHPVQLAGAHVVRHRHCKIIHSRLVETHKFTNWIFCDCRVSRLFDDLVNYASEKLWHSRCLAIFLGSPSDFDL